MRLEDGYAILDAIAWLVAQQHPFAQDLTVPLMFP